MSRVKLVYFDIKGLAETSRLILHVSGTEFEDYRYPIEIVNNNEEKIFRKPEFERDKKLGLLEKSFNKLPYLEITNDDKSVVLTQSKAIERYLAKKLDLMGKTLFEEARIDSFCEHIRDIRENYRNLSHYQKLKSDREKDSYFKKTLKKELENLTSLMDSSGSYCIGNKMSLADLSLYVLITAGFDEHKDVVFDVAAGIEKMRHVLVKISNNPKIREWVHKYPV